MYTITYGIVEEVLLVTSHFTLFNEIFESNENLVEKVTSENLKEVIISEKSSNFTHINIGNFINAIQIISMMPGQTQYKNILTNIKDLMLEINAIEKSVRNRYEVNSRARQLYALGPGG